MEHFDIVIVGAGIAGASVAWNLLRQVPTLKVLMIEQEYAPGYHSTGRSAAMFMESYGPPQARALTRESRRFYFAPPADFCQTDILSRRGCVYVAWSGQEAALRALQDELSVNTKIEYLSPQALCELVPSIRTEVDGRKLIGALSEPGAMDIDVDALHQSYLKGFKAGGGVSWTGARLTQITGEVSGGYRLECSDGRSMSTALLINAAGAWGDEVAALAGVAPVGLQPCRRSAFTFDAISENGQTLDSSTIRQWPTVGSVDVSWYFKPEAGLLLGSPANADPVHPHDVVAEELDIATAIAAIEAHSTLSIRRPKRTWAGLRTFAPDEELVIGFEPTATSFFWLVGQGGYGIQSAQGAASLACYLILSKMEIQCANLIEEKPDIAAMSPARFR